MIGNVAPHTTPSPRANPPWGERDTPETPPDPLALAARSLRTVLERLPLAVGAVQVRLPGSPHTDDFGDPRVLFGPDVAQRLPDLRLLSQHRRLDGLRAHSLRDGGYLVVEPDSGLALRFKAPPQVSPAAHRDAIVRYLRVLVRTRALRQWKALASPRPASSAERLCHFFSRLASGLSRCMGEQRVD